MKLLNLNIGIKLDNNKQVIKLIKESNYDICTFQEAMNATDKRCFEMYKSKNKLVQIKDFNYYAFGPLFKAKGITKNGKIVRNFGGKAEQGNLLICKYPIKKYNNLFYYNNYKKEYDATFFRNNDWCRSLLNTIINLNGKDIQIINVHGIWTKDKKDDERTLKQTDFILKLIRDDIPSMIVGDFNLLPENNSIKKLSTKMKNLISIYNIKRTRPPFNDGLDNGNNICDYIFVNDKIKINDFKILETNISDHYPLVIDFEI